MRVRNLASTHNPLELSSTIVRERYHTHTVMRPPFRCYMVRARCTSKSVTPYPLSANVTNFALRLKSPTSRTTTGGHGSQTGDLAAPGLRRLRRQARVVATLCNVLRDT